MLLFIPHRCRHRRSSAALLPQPVGLATSFAGQALPASSPVHVGRASRRCRSASSSWASSRLTAGVAAMILAAAPALLLVPALLLLPAEPSAAPAKFARHLSFRVPRGPSCASPPCGGSSLSGALLISICTHCHISSRVPQHAFTDFHLASSGTVSGVVYITGGLTGCALSWLFRGRRHSPPKRWPAANRLRNLAGRSPARLFRRAPAGRLPARRWLFPHADLLFCSRSSTYGLVYSAIQDLVAPNQRGAHHGQSTSWPCTCAAAPSGRCSPAASAISIAHRAPQRRQSPPLSTEALRAVGLQQAMLIIPVLSVALAAVLFAGSRTMATDAGQREPAATSAAAVAD